MNEPFNLDNHCGVAGCRCSHTHGCVKGWVWGNFIDKKIVHKKDGAHEVVTQEYDSVSPCANCDPDRAEIFHSAKSRWELQEALRNRSKSTRSQHYQDEERSKTRTL